MQKPVFMIFMNGSSQEKKQILFEEKGPENTMDCFEAVAERMEELGIDQVIVASTSGDTGSKAVSFFEERDFEVVVVSHQYGFLEDGEIELKEENRKIIEKSENASLVITPDILTRVPKIVRGKYGGFSNLDLIADTLRMFCEGMKVCIECVIQSADSGKIPVGEEVAAIAGTASGADTGIILESQHSHKIFDIGIREIICMPRGR